jgi:hypothetical protein
MKLRYIVLFFLLCLTGWLSISHSNTSDDENSLPINTSHQVQITPKRILNEKMPQVEKVNMILDRQSLIGNQDFKRKPKDLFTLKLETNIPLVREKPAPPPPPSAPNIPFKYLGKKLDDGVLEIYLEMNQELFIAKENTILKGIYRIDLIEFPHINLTYLPLNQAQVFTITSNE